MVPRALPLRARLRQLVCGNSRRDGRLLRPAGRAKLRLPRGAVGAAAVRPAHGADASRHRRRSALSPRVPALRPRGSHQPAGLPLPLRCRALREPPLSIRPPLRAAPARGDRYAPRRRVPTLAPAAAAAAALRRLLLWRPGQMLARVPDRGRAAANPEPSPNAYPDPTPSPNPSPNPNQASRCAST